MEKKSQLFILMELIWWVVTAIIAFAVLYPIYQSTVDYPFWTINIIFIVAAVTIIRLVFLTKFSFLADSKYLKVVLVMITVPIIFLLVEQMIGFQSYIDEEGLNDVLQNLSESDRGSMFNYIRTEMLFFAMAAILGMVALPVKMVKSVWRDYNPGR